LFLVNTVPRNW